MANYNSTHTGNELDAIIQKGLDLGSVKVNHAFDGVTYTVYFKVQPTSSNDVFGYAVNPSTGKVCGVRCNKGQWILSGFSDLPDRVSSVETQLNGVLTRLSNI